jgi:hypothetical protein
MSIQLTPFEYEAICHGSTWVVVDEDKLAEQVASVALGHAWHVQKILAGAKLGPPPTTESAGKGAIALLTVAGGDNPWHRDGWVFQVMSWLAAHAATPGGVIRQPHMIHAHKGFDGLQLELDAKTGAVSAAIIFEDKATENPRATIRKEVWPGLEQLEAGDRENVLASEVASLLQTFKDIDADVAIQNVIWKQARHYRVSVTVGDAHASDAGRKRLFRNYDAVAVGAIKKRRGETFYVKDLRKWMAALAVKAVAAVQGKVASNV